MFDRASASCDALAGHWAWFRTHTVDSRLPYLSKCSSRLFFHFGIQAMQARFQAAFRTFKNKRPPAQGRGRREGKGLVIRP